MKIHRKPSQEEMVKGDRIMFTIIIIAAIALALFTYQDHKHDITTTTNIAAK